MVRGCLITLAIGFVIIIAIIAIAPEPQVVDVTATREPSQATDNIDAKASAPRVTVIRITATPAPHLTPAKTVIRATATSPRRPTAIGTSTSTPPPQPKTFGATYVVGNTDGEGVYIRRSPNMSDRIKAWPDDTAMVEVASTVEAEGRYWRNVRDPEGNEGFVPSQYLVGEKPAVAVATTQAHPTSTPSAAEVPAYNIAKTEDVSYGNTKRIVYKVIINSSTSRADLLQIASSIVEARHGQANHVNAVGFFFYFPNSNIAGSADAAIDWAPAGDWSKAHTVKTGDYSKHRLSVQFYNPRNPERDDGEVTRRRIFKEVVAAEDQLAADALRKFPRDDQWEERADMVSELRDTYRMRVAEKHGITMAELKPLISEAIRERWPLD